MTVSTTTTKVTYAGNGATLLFTFPFIGVSGDDLIVQYTNSIGTITTLNPSTYTLVINAIPTGGLWGIGGSVTYPIGGSPVPIATGTSIAIIRAVPYIQDVSIANQGAFYPRAVEQGLDLLELQIQQLETRLDYTLQFPLSDLYPPDVLPSADVRADGFLGFDSDGQPTIVYTNGGGSFAVPRVITTTGTATNNILTSDSRAGVSIYQSSTPVTTIQLPADGGGPYPIFDGGFNAGTYPITVLPSAGKLIGGFSSYSLNFDGQSISVVSDGTQWLIL